MRVMHDFRGARSSLQKRRQKRKEEGSKARSCCRACGRGPLPAMRIGADGQAASAFAKYPGGSNGWRSLRTSTSEQSSTARTQDVSVDSQLPLGVSPVFPCPAGGPPGRPFVSLSTTYLPLPPLQHTGTSSFHAPVGQTASRTPLRLVLCRCPTLEAENGALLITAGFFGTEWRQANQSDAGDLFDWR